MRTTPVFSPSRLFAFTLCLAAGCGGGGGGEGEYGQKFEAPKGAEIKAPPAGDTAKTDLSGKGRRAEAEEDNAPAKGGGRR